MKMSKKMLEGVIVAMVTPFDEHEEVDLNSLKEIVDYFIEQGVHGILVCGSTGEFAALSSSERKKMFDIVINHVDGRVPVVCGTSACSTKATIELTKYAENAGADAVLVVPPFYTKPKENEVYEHYKLIAESTKLPIIIYNNPWTSKVDIPPHLIAKLAEFNNIKYVKESSGDITRIWKIRSLTNDGITVFCGSENQALESFVMGAKGWVSAAANIIPKQTVELYETACVKKDFLKARILYEKLLPLLNMLEESGKYIHFSKAALRLIGKKAGNPRKPLLPISPEEEETLKKLLPT